mgnify:CR=1 FL=1
MESFIIIGLGKVGTSIASLLKKAGYTIAAVVDPSDDALNANLVYTGGKPFHHPSDLDIDADCYLITTTDDQIKAACGALADHVRPDAVVLHMSGAGGLDLLDAVRRTGAKTGSMHPLQTFSDVQSAVDSLPGTVYGVTVDPDLRDWSEKLVRAIGGIPFFIDEKNRALYHAAACMVSNYFVTLMYMAEQTYGLLGLDEQKARHAYWPLLRGTLQNIEKKGSISSLTGPIARGDLGTVKKHLRTITANIPELLPAYRELGKITADIALKKNTISSQQSSNIKLLLSKGA